MSSLGQLGTECSTEGRDGSVGPVRSSLQERFQLRLQCHECSEKEVCEFGRHLEESPGLAHGPLLCQLPALTFPSLLSVGPEILGWLGP